MPTPISLGVSYLEGVIMATIAHKCPFCLEAVLFEKKADVDWKVKCPKCGREFSAPPAATSDYRPEMGPADPEATKSYSLSASDTFPESVETSGARQVPGYEILGLLGQGGMGSVYQARDLKLKRLVALKMIRAGWHARSTARDRFIREAQAAAALQHPNIVQVFEVGEHGGLPYFSLEFVAGGTLKDRLAGSTLPAADAARLTEMLARAVHVAHRHNIIHRDLKPSNVLLAGSPDGPVEQWLPKITDFGLAKQLDVELGQTQSGEIMGTPSYMAPEQAAGDIQALGPATDVYALGAVLYELLTGRPPVKAASIAEALEQVRYQEPVAPTRLQPKLPRDLETICLKCLEKEASKRYESAEALADDLHRFLSNEPIVARPSSLGSRALKWAWRRPAVAVGLGISLVALVLLVVMGSLWYQAELQAAADLAQQKSLEAEREKHRAETEKDLRGRAQAGEADATAKKLLAEKETKRAEEQTSIAKTETKRAEEQTKIAQEQTKLAREQTKLAQARANELRRGAFAMQLARAAELQEREPAYALELLQDTRWCPPELHDFTWRFLQRVCKRDFRKLEVEPSTELGVLAYSSDGKTLAAGCDNGSVVLWQAPSGKPLGVLTGTRGPIHALAFCGQGKMLASAGQDRIVRFWDVTTRKEMVRWEGHDGPVRGLAVSGDNKLMAAGSGGGPRLWDLEKRREIAVLPSDHPVYAVVFSPDGKTLAGGGGHQAKVIGEIVGAVTVWDLDNKKIKATLKDHYAPVRSLAFSLDGAMLASAEGLDVYSTSSLMAGSVALWDTISLKKRAELATGPVNALAFSPDKKTLATARGGLVAFERGGAGVNLWETAVGRQHTLLGGHNDPRNVRALAFSPDGRIVAAATSREVTLWDLSRYGAGRILAGHGGGVLALAFAPDGKSLLAGTEDNWKPGKRQSSGIAVAIRGVEAGPARAQRWDLGSEKIQQALEGHKNRVHVVAYSPDGKYLLTGGGGGGFLQRDFGELLLRDAAGRIQVNLSGHKSLVTAVAFSPDSKLLASGSIDGVIKLWKLAGGKEIASRAVSKDPVTSLAISPDGKTLAVGGGIPAHFPPQSGVAIQVKGLGPVAAEVHLLDLPGLQEQSRIPMKATILAVAFAPHGRSLVITLDSATAVLWDVSAGKVRALLEGHRGSVPAAAFSADGKTLATASIDGTVKLWDPDTGQLRGTLASGIGRLACLAFSSSGQTLAAGSLDGDTICWHATLATPSGDVLVQKKELPPEGIDCFIEGVQDGRIKLRRKLPTRSWEKLTLAVGPGCTVKKASINPESKKILVGDDLPGGFKNSVFNDLDNAVLKAHILTTTDEKEATAVRLFSLSYSASLKKVQDGKVVLLRVRPGKQAEERTLALAASVKVFQQHMDFEAVTVRRGVEFSPEAKNKFFQSLSKSPASVQVVTDPEGRQVNEIDVSFLQGVFPPKTGPFGPPFGGPPFGVKPVASAGGKIVHSVKGELAATDPLDKVRTKSHCKVHAFKMAPGSIYTIDLVSTDFDSFLRLENAEGRQLAFDDDGGGGFNSRIVFRPLKEEEFRIIATTFPIGQTGKYTLTIRQAVQPVPGKVLFSHKDRLSADDPPDKVRRNPHKVHTFKMKAGQVYFLDLVSTEFDTYLRLEDSSGKQLAEDDDSGGNLNARIVFHAQREDNYRIIATSYQAGASGMYTLTVREALAPAAAK